MHMDYPIIEMDRIPELIKIKSFVIRCTTWNEVEDLMNYIEKYKEFSWIGHGPITTSVKIEINDYLNDYNEVGIFFGEICANKSNVEFATINYFEKETKIQIFNLIKESKIKINKEKYPNICPKCGQPAYIGSFVVECSNDKCLHHK